MTAAETTTAYMSISQATEILGLSRQRIYALIDDGRLNRFYIPGRRRGMVPRLLADDVHAYAQKRSEVPAPRPRSTPPPARLTGARTPPPPVPVTEEDRIVAVLVLTGIVDMLDVYRVANRRILGEFERFIEETRRVDNLELRDGDL